MWIRIHNFVASCMCLPLNRLHHITTRPIFNRNFIHFVAQLFSRAVGSQEQIHKLWVCIAFLIEIISILSNTQLCYKVMAMAQVMFFAQSYQITMSMRPCLTKHAHEIASSHSFLMSMFNNGVFHPFPHFPKAAVVLPFLL